MRNFFIAVIAASVLWTYPAHSDEAKADFNRDGVIDFPDFLAFVGAFGSTDRHFDLNGDGIVDFSDFLIFVQNFNRTVKHGERILPFRRGVNIARWIQYQNANPDIVHNKQTLVDLKSLGIDVVRIPFGAKTSGPPDFTIEPHFFEYVDQVIDWAESIGLYVILDNHNNGDSILGPKYGPERSARAEEYLRPLWTQIATRYKHRSKYLIYEILNEPWADERRWGVVQGRIIDVIRGIDPDRKIVVTGGNFGSWSLNDNLPDYDDENLIYTFHFYMPKPFIRQGGGWTDTGELLAADPNVNSIPWPYAPEDLAKGMEKHAHQGTKEYLVGLLDDVVEFSKERDVPVYCGEFGAILGPNFPRDDYYKYFRFLREYFEDNDIAWTMWTSLALYERGSDRHFDYDLHTGLLEALGLRVPPQSEWVIETKTSAFDIYTDQLAPGISPIADEGWVRGWIEFDNNDVVYSGSNSIFATRLTNGNRISLEFMPNVDLSLLRDTHSLEFYIWCNQADLTVQVGFGARFFPIRPPWESGWRKVSIPLSRFSTSADPLDWTDVDRLDFRVYADQGDSIIRIDDIRIVNPGG